MSDMPQIIRDLAREVLRLATERPDFRYGADINDLNYDINDLDLNGSDCYCYYHKSRGGKEGQGCIFGQAFVALGYEPNDAWTQMGDIAGVLLTMFGIRHVQSPSISEALSTFLDIQAAQDGGFTWGDAVGNHVEQLERLAEPVRGELAYA